MANQDDEQDYSVLPDVSRLKAARKAKKWTQEKLAEKAGCSKRTIENAEAGKRIMKDILGCIAEALGCAVEELISPSSEAVVFTQEMLESVPLPVFFKDAKGIYRGCNERFCRYIGRDREHILNDRA